MTYDNTNLKIAVENIYCDYIVKDIEKRRNAKFVGEFASNKHSTETAMLFYQETPPVEGYSKYFVVYQNSVTGMYMVASGETMSKAIRTGVLTDKGDFIYSRNRHDYILHGTDMVDGGDSYLRCNEGATLIDFKIVKDKLVEV